MTVVDYGPAAQRDPALSSPLAPGPGAKDRIVAVADSLFYSAGIHAVGIDRLISESCVTKATFYKHFGAKETLVVRYVQNRHHTTRDLLMRVAETASDAQSAIRLITDHIVTQSTSSGFRGCAFINAATEYPDSRHLVRDIVSAHRDWYTAFMAELFRELGHPMPGDAADEFVLMRDGAMSGGYASDPIAASAALVRSVDRLLDDACRV
ncbi:MAG: TetR family transcriptional regulator [Microbacteriaceae bacterium]|nr:TetR family transcriptional regulator [Microbacteriaceae bacterium]